MDPRRRQLAEKLQTGIARLELVLDGRQQAQLLDYLLLLEKWNSAYNLSGIRDAERMVAYHLLDSLAIAPFIAKAMTVLDVGTGGGLPGIPLAICYPDKSFLLLDSNGKKTRFLFQVKTELGLGNVTVIHDRVEAFQSSRQIDIVLCRAFAPLDRMLQQTGHLLHDNSRVLAMKGQLPAGEIAALPADFVVASTHDIAVPGVEGSRHLIEIVPVPGRNTGSQQ